MKLLEVSIHTQQESAEAVSAILMQLGAGGTVLDEAFDWEKAKREGLGDYFPEEKGLQAKETIVRGYFPVSLGSAAEKTRICSRLTLAFPRTVAIREVDDKDWAWKEYWQPQRWGKACNCPCLVWKHCEQGAFPSGSGSGLWHGTHSTRLCLGLEEIRLQDKSVTDLGCGSVPGGKLLQGRPCRWREP